MYGWQRLPRPAVSYTGNGSKGADKVIFQKMIAIISITPVRTTPVE
jgi:hypothetical protein